MTVIMLNAINGNHFVEAVCNNEPFRLPAGVGEKVTPTKDDLILPLWNTIETDILAGYNLRIFIQGPGETYHLTPMLPNSEYYVLKREETTIVHTTRGNDPLFGRGSWNFVSGPFPGHRQAEDWLDDLEKGKVDES